MGMLSLVCILQILISHIFITRASSFEGGVVEQFEDEVVDEVMNGLENPESPHVLAKEKLSKKTIDFATVEKVINNIAIKLFDDIISSIKVFTSDSRELNYIREKGIERAVHEGLILLDKKIEEENAKSKENSQPDMELESQRREE